MEKEDEKPVEVIFRDIRRYYCEYCGICRSKKSLISSHIMKNHKEELKLKEQNDEKVCERKLNTCKDCGASFRKLAYLKQHMQSHSLERPFSCPIEDCHSSYRRKDHMTRHLLQHQGKLFECPVVECKQRYAFHGNMIRHMKARHGESTSNVDQPRQKDYVCPELGCGKVFKYACRLQKHMDSHVKLDSVEALCAEPGCMKYFSNEKCLKEHLKSCQRHIVCDLCGSKQLRKNIKQHLRSHDVASSENIKCSFEGCSLEFSTTSNLNQHVKAVHLELKPYSCGVRGCGKRFAYKHVRDNHEKSGCHVYLPENFEEYDEQFRSRPRGGRKRIYPDVETLLGQMLSTNEGPESHSHVFSMEP